MNISKFIAISTAICMLLGAIFNSRWLYILAGVFAILEVIAIYDLAQTKHSIWHNFPVIGHFRWGFEEIRPEIQQYFVESNNDGKPFSRAQRSDVYQKAKKVSNTVPFGTQLDLYAPGAEWVNQSIYPIKSEDIKPLKFILGGPQCIRRYNASIINSSAMSFGALSKNAILAINGAAQSAKFMQNTGEGGISKYHLEKGGDLMWQVGTGYFGCRTLDGLFDKDKFIENATRPQVKAIELKLSQGAKPGHGGILPGVKNTPEIAAIRGVKPYTMVVSPPYHTAFTNAESLIKFLDILRSGSLGKPVGFKLCLGDISELDEILREAIIQNIYPDFITIDGAEGGTGAAPLLFSNNVGTPLIDALAQVDNKLKELNIRQYITIIVSGKVTTGFDVVRLLSLGADGINIARGFLFSLGCIQALKCNNDKCPTGIATQNAAKIKGLVVADKEVRVSNYHESLIKDVIELLAAMGINDYKKLTRKHIHRRVEQNIIKTYEDLYPYYEKITETISV
jgi:glutamate synthase domain-containing protein 2